MREEILKKFLSNKCSYKECESIVRHLLTHEQDLDKIHIFENIPHEELTTTPPETKQAILNSILSRKRTLVTLQQLLVAAAILIAAAFPFYKIGSFDTLTFEENNLRISLKNEGITSYWHQLPDSSRIKLEPQSKVVYYSNFRSNRSVQQIYGKATYYVHPDKEHPFRVNKHGLQTKALGTIFSVADYDKSNLVITLLEGKILVSNKADQRVFLNSQATLVINKDNFQYRLVNPPKTNFTNAWEKEKEHSKSNFPASTIAWSNKVVNFKSVSNADLFNIMERLYAVTIDATNPNIINGTFTGDLKQNENIENLLAIFCQINGCQFNIEENIITIK